MITVSTYEKNIVLNNETKYYTLREKIKRKTNKEIKKKGKM